MKLVWVAPLMALTLAACGQVGAIGIPLGGGAATPAAATGQPTDFNTAAPTTPVTTDPLPPPVGYDPGPVATNPTTTPTTTTTTTTTTGPLPPANAAGEPNQAGALAANAGAAVRSTDLIGGWTVTAGSDTCQLFMTLTAWTGGYRASTRDCSSAVLQSISAWNLSGASVTLASSDGTTLATLGSVSATRFEGQLVAGGTPIAFFR
ncbi:MAG: AprI/Inh family metalloprotease inhibitor [Bauldia sp.]|nr:AprI/Inh family metalloprotease inhibitor [Bauldia sp.]